MQKFIDKHIVLLAIGLGVMIVIMVNVIVNMNEYYGI